MHLYTSRNAITTQTYGACVMYWEAIEVDHQRTNVPLGVYKRLISCMDKPTASGARMGDGVKSTPVGQLSASSLRDLDSDDDVNNPTAHNNKNEYHVDWANGELACYTKLTQINEDNGHRVRTLLLS